MEKTGISRRGFIKKAAVSATGIAAMGVLGGFGIGEKEVEAAVNPVAAGKSVAAVETPVAPLETTIYCIDRFITKPGEGAEFLNYFLSDFGPKAQAFGMKLESTLVAPPVWLKNESNTIEIVWSIAGFNGWAAMVQQSRFKEQNETIEFWKKVNSVVVSHDRSYFANESDMEVLNNV